jgi:hypothetical protein
MGGDMFQRIQQYPLITGGTRVYRPRAYGDPQPDGTWGGWLVFFPLDGGRAIASNRETTQTSFGGLVHWASTLTDVYLSGALDRALQIDQRPPVLADLVRAEYEALEDAEQLQAAAEIEHVTAFVEAEAATSAREDAEQIRREREATESKLEAVNEIALSDGATIIENARRGTAADTRSRRRRAEPRTVRSKRGH